MKKPWTGRLFGSRNFWLCAMSAHQHGHPRLANGIRAVNSLLYHNSLPVKATVASDVQLAHHGIGTVIHHKVRIASGVKICQNVTIAVRPSRGGSNGIFVDENVLIGANSVIITPRNEDIRIGKGAKIAAGAVVIEDVPPGATMVGNPARVATKRASTAPSPEPAAAQSN
ncbi:MAG TPA: hypothetical protein VGX69_04270 [Solirubrobacteraceae bacterium]|jgi:serine O-acetyltransferase|nr:hypothetical protein [Solirubrobacteraceae bacterium]